MVQRVGSFKIPAGKKKMVLEKPLVLHRVFFSVCRIQTSTAWYPAMISFDDPSFYSYYVLNGAENKFKAEGADIFQGNVWVRNSSTTDLWFAVTEILH